MSGHRIKRGEPVFKEKLWRWGPPGWYCCGNRLMAPAELPGGAQVHRCLHCGVVVAVTGQEITELQRPAPDNSRSRSAMQSIWQI